MPINCAIDGYVYFQWYAASHDIQLMASEAAYESCDFSGAVTLQPLNAPANLLGYSSYYMPCTTPGAVQYLSCSVSDHCARGQKLTVFTSPTEYAINTSTSPPTTLLHSDSLADVMTLLGHRIDESTGFSYIERGFQTEASATVSLELIWCLEAHCPTSALDFQLSATATSCLAQVYNLGGYIMRKRPTPDFAHAEQYYLTALSHEPTHCPTLEYLSELYLMTSNAYNASATALRLCSTCGTSSSVTLQAKHAFDVTYPNVVGWPCQVDSPPSPPLQPGQELVHQVTTTLTIQATLETFDRDAFTTTFAAAAGVAASAVSLAVSSASVVVVAKVTAATAGAAASIASLLSAVMADPNSASSALSVAVLSIDVPPAVSSVARSLPQEVGSPSAAVVGGAVGGGVVFLLVLALIWCRCRTKSGASVNVARQGAKMPHHDGKAHTTTRPHQTLEINSTPSTMSSVPYSAPPSPPGSADVRPRPYVV